MFFLLLLLLGTVKSAKSNVVYGKDIGRLSRYPYDVWNPIRDAPSHSRHVQSYMLPPRYPGQHGNKAYAYSPSKRIMNQPVAENSDTVEVFSPAPPSILGSFSVFGHATVNAREPASQINKKLPQHQFSVDYPNYERQQQQGYKTRNQYGSSGFYQPNEPQTRPNRFSDYNNGYSFESTLRPPPPREAVNKVSSYSSSSQSTTLPPNTYYYDQIHQFQPSAMDNSYEKIRKPNPSYHYASTPGYPTLKPGNYRATLDNNYDQSPVSYYKSYNAKGNQPLPLPSSSWNNNPFGDITFGTRQPVSYSKPVIEEKEPAKDIYSQYSHLSRPFQGSQYTTTTDTKDVDTYSPYVTTYPSSSETQNVKVSNEAQPFQVNDDYRTQGVPFAKPDSVATQDPFSQEVYPITVTTIDVPTEPEIKKKFKNRNRGESHFSEVNTLPGPSSHNNYDSFINNRPGVEVVSYQSFNEKVLPTFLPTPTPDNRPSAPPPTMYEVATNQPEDSSNSQDINYISTIDNKYGDSDEGVTDSSVTTTAVIETTTTTPTTPKTRPTIKSRRRPSRPTQKTTESTNNNYNQLPEDEYSTSVDYNKHQRRRKPNNKYRETSEYKRYRTTTTTSTSTTTAPPTEAATETNMYTTVEDEANQMNDNYFARPLNEFTNLGYYSSYNGNQYPPVESLFSSQSPEHFTHNLSYADIFGEEPVTSSTTTTTPAPTTSLTVTPRMKTTTSTTTTITQSPVSVTPPNMVSPSSLPARLKNKYGNNRPRFSVKDYRDRMNKANSSPPSLVVNEDETTPKPRNESSKILSRVRPSLQQRSTTETPPQVEETTPEPKYRKYKPRLGPSRTFYKTSTTTQPDSDTTTTERVNTFRPSTNRYKPGTGKYYSRYRTSSLSPKEIDDSPFTTTAKITIKPKGVFSAKRRPHPMKSRTEDDDDGSFEDSSSMLNFGDSLKINDNEVVPSVASKKMDDATTTTMMSSEEKDLNLNGQSQPSLSFTAPNMPPSGNEAMRIADLTSSSSNDFNSPNIFKPYVVPIRRVIPKIMIATEEPILPLEAFFQTRNKNK